MRRFWFAIALAAALGLSAVVHAQGDDQPLQPYGDDDTVVDPYTDDTPPPPAPPPPYLPSRTAKRAPVVVATAPQPAPTPAPAPVIEPAQPVPAAVLPAYAPLKVIGIMPETGQALMFDESRNEYVLGRVGMELDGWKVMAIEEGRVIVTAGGMRDELPLLPAPTVFQGQREARRLPPVIVASPETPAPQAIVIPPVPQPPVVVQAVPPPAPTPPPAAAPPKEIEETYKMSHAEFDTRLGDFDRMLREVEVDGVEGSGFRITRLDAKSWLNKMGLKQGDLVLSVAGERVSTVEDGARVYARLLSSKMFNVEVDRGGQRVLLHFDLSKP